MAAGVILRASIPQALRPGVKEFWGKYEEHPNYYERLFEKVSSDKNYEEYTQITNMGLVEKKPENSAVKYDEIRQGYTTRIDNNAYARGFIVSREAKKDGKYLDILKRGVYALGFAFRQTKETVAANVYNRGFNSSYVGGDGVELLSTAHPTAVGNQSNELAVAADFSEAAVEDLCIQIEKATDEVGNKIALQTRCLFGTPDNKFEFERLTDSVLRIDSANNDINAIRNMEMFPEGYITNPFLSDADAFFIKTNAMEGMIHQEREPLEFSMDNDFDTDNHKYKGYERYEFKWADWRGVYGSPGA